MAGVMTIAYPVMPLPLSRASTAGVRTMHPVLHHPQATATQSVLDTASSAEAMDTMDT